MCDADGTRVKSQATEQTQSNSQALRQLGKSSRKEFRQNAQLTRCSLDLLHSCLPWHLPATALSFLTSQIQPAHRTAVNSWSHIGKGEQRREQRRTSSKPHLKCRLVVKTFQLETRRWRNVPEKKHLWPSPAIVCWPISSPHWSSLVAEWLNSAGPNLEHRFSRRRRGRRCGLLELVYVVRWQLGCGPQNFSQDEECKHQLGASQREQQRERNSGKRTAGKRQEEADGRRETRRGNKQSKQPSHPVLNG